MQSGISIEEYYNSNAIEKDRLEQHVSRLEKIRSQEIIQRYLKPGNVVADVGGATGTYSFWLHQKGYTVHLLDAASSHIEIAKHAAKKGNMPLASVSLGDARALPYLEQQFDMLLLLGPLYHLQKVSDRIQALQEARRVLKPGGIVLAATISRYASLFDGFWRNLIIDPEFEGIMKNDLVSGRHHNPTNKIEYFTDAYFHTELEIKSEFSAAGFPEARVMAIEGFGWLIPDFDKRWEDLDYREKLLEYIALTETDPIMVGMSAHVMTVGMKGDGHK